MKYRHSTSIATKPGDSDQALKNVVLVIVLMYLYPYLVLIYIFNYINSTYVLLVLLKYLSDFLTTIM